MEQMTLRGTLKGHNGWVTQIATTPQDPNQILSASRDKTLILWELNRDDEMNYGVPKKCLTGLRRSALAFRSHSTYHRCEWELPCVREKKKLPGTFAHVRTGRLAWLG